MPNLDAHVNRLQESLAIRRAVEPSLKWKSEPWKPAQLDAPENLKDLLVEKLHRTLQEAQQKEGLATDLSAVALLVQGHRGIEVYLHVTPIGWPTASLNRPGCAEVFVSGSRVNAAAKDSQWLRDRAGIEAALSPGAEGLLCTQEGLLLEGLVTNVFVVREDGAVQTASPSADLVLDGIMRRSIIRCCQELGVQVVESAPNVSDRHLWQEGFLTNCLRVIQPLSSMKMYDGSRKDGQWACSFDAPNLVTRRLHRAVMSSMQEQSCNQSCM